jgi:penicillin-insensitive murein endopeptidase
MLTPVDVIAGLWLSLWCVGGAPCQLLPLATTYAQTTAPVAVVVQTVTPAPTTPIEPATVVAPVPVPAPAPAAAPAPRPERLERPSALLELSDDEILRRIEADPASIGSLSIGPPGSSLLYNAVELPESPRWSRAPNAEWWATTETVEAVEAAVGTVHNLFPDTQPIVIGDISRHDGGRVQRHESHQGGRDVDFGFYYKNGSVNWWAPGSSGNMDLPRNWALVRALVTRTDVEVVFLDTRVQRVLYAYAKEIGEDTEWLDRVFQFTRGYRNAIIQHLPNHRTHYHVRFYSPVAQELARRAHPMLVQLDIMKPPVYTVRVVARSGQTLGAMASRYGTSVRAIMQANGLTSSQIRAGRTYRIPVRAAAPPMEPLLMPRRVLPPVTPAVLATVEWPTFASLYGSGQLH